MTFPEAVALMIGVGILMLGLMWLGWRGRQRRSAPLVGALPTAPESLGDQLVANVPGIYVSSTTHGDWLDRVAAQDLGYRSTAIARVFEHGVLIERAGARDVYIPVDQLINVSLTNGIAGKVLGTDAIVLIEWHVGAKYADEETLLDTGFKPDSKHDRALLVDAISKIIPSTPQVKESK